MRGFSHDLRNPLGVADAHAWLLEQGKPFGPLQPKQLESVGKIRKSIQSSVQLIDDLLELTRLEAGQIKILRVPTDVSMLIADLAGDLQELANGHRIVARDEPGLSVETDPMRVREILENLVSNALKYSTPGTITLAAKVRNPRGHKTDGRWIGVSVIDSGPGIPADKAESIFEEFTRLAPNTQDGSGIGLAISRRIARLLDGDLELENPGENHSAFTLWLPVRREPAHGAAA